MVVTLTSRMELQTHSLANFLTLPEQRWGTPYSSRKQKGKKKWPASSSTSSTDAEEAPFNFVSASESIAPSLASSPSVVVMCPHWFIGQEEHICEHEDGDDLAAGTSDIWPCVAQITRNGKFIFTGGHNDKSVKCHLLNHKPRLPSNNLSVSPASITCKPASSVSKHHAVVTAIALSQSQNMLVTGSADGAVNFWRVYTTRQDRNRPPLAAAPHACFSVHSGPVIGVALNILVGTAVSLAKDIKRSRGLQMAIYSTKSGRFVRSVEFKSSALVDFLSIKRSKDKEKHKDSQASNLSASTSPTTSQAATQAALSSRSSVILPDGDPDLDMKLVAICPAGNIVLYGVMNDLPYLFLYSINGVFVTMTRTDSFINVLCCTPYQLKTHGSYQGFVVTGSQQGAVVFRHQHNLEPVQTFFCDGRIPSSLAHTVEAPIGVEKADDVSTEMNVISSEPVPEHRSSSSSTGGELHEDTAHTGIAAVDLSGNMQYLVAST